MGSCCSDGFDVVRSLPFDFTPQSGPMPSDEPVSRQRDQPTLSLADAVAIVVGTIIGAGVYRIAPLVANNVDSVFTLMLLWSVGGLLSFNGALCFAEMADRFRGRVGGDWVYLREAFGPRLAFLFAWAAFWVIRPGNTAAMCVAFGEYGGQLTGIDWFQTHHGEICLGIGGLVALMLVNLRGLQTGAGTLRMLTLLKVVGIAGLILVLFAGSTGPQAPATASEIAGVATTADATVDPPAATEANWLVALMFIMFAFGGWNDVAFVTGEIRNPEKNVLRGLLLGILTVTLLFVGLNAGFIWTLGLDGVQQSTTVATDAIAVRLENWNWASAVAGKITSLLVCISCLGAINAMLITSPRIFFAAVEDWPSLSARLSQMGRAGEMRFSLLATCAVTGLLLLVSFWISEAFDAVVTVTAPWFWVFLALVPAALIVLRMRQGPGSNWRAPLYPLPPLILLVMCLYLAWTSVMHIISLQLWLQSGGMLVLMLAGAAIATRLKKRTD